MHFANSHAGKNGKFAGILLHDAKSWMTSSLSIPKTTAFVKQRISVRLCSMFRQRAISPKTRAAYVHGKTVSPVRTSHQFIERLCSVFRQRAISSPPSDLGLLRCQVSCTWWQYLLRWEAVVDLLSRHQLSPSSWCDHLTLVLFLSTTHNTLCSGLCHFPPSMFSHPPSEIVQKIRAGNLKRNLKFGVKRQSTVFTKPSASCIKMISNQP